MDVWEIVDWIVYIKRWFIHVNISIQLAIVSMYDTKVPSYLYLCYGFFIFFPRGVTGHPWVNFPL